MFRKFFNRKRECPECGFQGSSREFKRAGSSNRKKNMKHIHEANADEGTSGSSGDQPTFRSHKHDDEKEKQPTFKSHRHDDEKEEQPTFKDVSHKPEEEQPTFRSHRHDDEENAETSGSSGSSGSSGDVSAARERWEQDVEGYEHKQFDEAKEEYGRARKELDERFKEKIEKIKAQAAFDLGTSGSSGSSGEGNVGEGNVGGGNV
jgi:hypothetical protein